MRWILWWDSLGAGRTWSAAVGGVAAAVGGVAAAVGGVAAAEGV